jgi:hypothetical protein
MANGCRQQQSPPFGLHVNVHYFFLPILTLDFVDNMIEAHNIRFHRNSSSGRHAETCRQTDGRTDGPRDMTELIWAFDDYAKAHKLLQILISCEISNCQFYFTDKSQHICNMLYMF